MKLFHISDLHLGKRIYEFSMLEEQRELLLEILRSIDEEQPQALLISGDIYDKPVPPTEAVKLLDDFLTEVSKRGLHTYLIAGNHDSAQRLEFGKEIFGRESIHISGSIGEGLAHVTETDEYGTVEIWLLPFFKPAHVNALLREEEASSYAAAAKLLLEREKIDFSKRNVILVHQFVTWRGAAERSDSETLSLGGVDEIDAGLFFDFDYVALGHLHNPQKLGRETVRYAGSPMPYSFSGNPGGKRALRLLNSRKKVWFLWILSHWKQSGSFGKSRARWRKSLRQEGKRAARRIISAAS